MSEKMKKKSRFFKKWLGIALAKGVNRINFLKLTEKLANSSDGLPWLDRFKALPPSWENADEVCELAVDLTLEQLSRENSPADRSEIKELIDQIAIQYDRRAHEYTAAAIGLVFSHLFEHQSPDLLFTSPDGRDLEHLDSLKSYREQGLGVVYLINHSSHLDEFLVDIVWQILSIGLPVFAAGQNMMSIPSIAELLMTGSYVVLRQGANRHQMAALYNYCSAISRAGAQQGIFLEAWRGGARTRDGSLRYPKRLVTLQGAIDVDRDVVIQPISLSYSVVPEDRMMCSKKSAWSWIRGMGFWKTLAGIPFHPRTFFWRSLENIYGRAYVTVPAPMLLSDLKKSHEEDRTGIALDEFVALSAIREIARSKKVMTSQITARGVIAAQKSETGDLLSCLRNEIEAVKEYHLATFNQAPDFEDFIHNNPVETVLADGLATLKKRGVLSRFRKDHLGLPRVKDFSALAYYATHGDRRLYSPTADQNVVVVGPGNWGFALSCLVGNRLLEEKKYNNASITVFDARPDMASQMGLHRRGPGRFSEVLLPKNVFVTCDYPSAFRKASEVIVASKPEDFEAHVSGILETSEQPMNIMLATRGFIPEMNCLPHTAVERLLDRYQRRDVRIFVIAGPIGPHDLVKSRSVNGILAGPGGGLDELADLFLLSPVKAFLSTDPVGVQTADILARVYAVWFNFMTASHRMTHPADIGYMAAMAGQEACSLALALGGDPETFTAGSIPWNSTLVSVCMKGPWYKFGQELGAAVKKGKVPSAMFKKLNRQWEERGDKLQSLTDLKEIKKCAALLGVEMPIIMEAHDTFWGMEMES